MLLYVSIIHSVFYKFYVYAFTGCKSGQDLLFSWKYQVNSTSHLLIFFTSFETLDQGKHLPYNKTLCLKFSTRTKRKNTEKLLNQKFVPKSLSLIKNLVVLTLIFCITVWTILIMYVTDGLSERFL